MSAAHVELKHVWLETLKSHIKSIKFQPSEIWVGLGEIKWSANIQSIHVVNLSVKKMGDPFMKQPYTWDIALHPKECTSECNFLSFIYFAARIFPPTEFLHLLVQICQEIKVPLKFLKEPCLLPLKKLTLCSCICSICFRKFHSSCNFSICLCSVCVCV